MFDARNQNATRSNNDDNLQADQSDLKTRLGLVVDADVRYWTFMFEARRYYENPSLHISSMQEAYEPIHAVIATEVFGAGADKFQENVKEGATFYRARQIHPDQISVRLGKSVIYDGYDEVNSREPMIGLGIPGRANPSGCSYLYVADNPETACAEIKQEVGALISVARFTCTKELQMVDFVSEQEFERARSLECGCSLGVLFTKLMADFFKPKGRDDAAAYMASQIISDDIRKYGVDGIMYRSLWCTRGINYVFFNCCRENFKFEGSEVFVQCGERSFRRLRDGKRFCASTSAPEDESDELAVLNDARKKLLR